RRRFDADAAEHESGGADALEVHVASKVIAAGAQRLERRGKPSLELHKIADRRRHALAQRYSDAFERFAHARTFHALDAQRAGFAMASGHAHAGRAGAPAQGGRQVSARPLWAWPRDLSGSAIAPPPHRG